MTALKDICRSIDEREVKKAEKCLEAVKIVSVVKTHIYKDEIITFIN